MANAAWRWSARLFVVAAVSFVGAPEYPALSRAIAKAFAVDVSVAPADPVAVPALIAAQPSLEAAVLAVPHDVTGSRESSTPPMRGMAPWAFGFALAGQLADIVTTEIGLARGLSESNHLMSRRMVRVPLKLALPLIARWATRNAPRGHANAQAVMLGAWGTGPAAWNVYAMTRW